MLDRGQQVASLDFELFLNYYKAELQQQFSNKINSSYLYEQRGLPNAMLKAILAHKPLSVFIPDTYGGRGGNVGECLSMLEASGYESLALSLMMGINGALFLQPLSIYGTDSVKSSIYHNFMHHNALGGLMITEPDYGSDALRMQTSYSELSDAYHVKGTKHWGGLTSWADYWIITARRRNDTGELSRDIDFFIHDTRNPGLEVTELYQNLGLRMLPYGKNEIDIQIPKEFRLEPEQTGLKLMLDMLHRSRIQFPGMGMGFLKRMLDEAVQHCKDRFVGGQSLFNYDQVKRRIADLQAKFTICSALCVHTSEHAGMDVDMSKDDLKANSVKTVITDYMQNAAQSLMQLVGAKAFTYDHIAGRSIVDSRPFQIFEGSNDILYQQISEAVVKMMKKINQVNLYEFLKNMPLTVRSADYLKSKLNFNLDLKMTQDKLVEFGQGFGRILALESVLILSEKGFNHQMIHNAVEYLTKEIDGYLSKYMSPYEYKLVEDYQIDSQWLPLVGK
jgi:alkylation response protein AidB-like acyl-CoA dehydrogenase